MRTNTLQIQETQFGTFGIYWSGVSQLHSHSSARSGVRLKVTSRNMAQLSDTTAPQQMMMSGFLADSLQKSTPPSLGSTIRENGDHHCPLCGVGSSLASTSCSIPHACDLITAIRHTDFIEEISDDYYIRGNHSRRASQFPQERAGVKDLPSEGVQTWWGFTSDRHLWLGKWLSTWLCQYTEWPQQGAGMKC